MGATVSCFEFVGLSPGRIHPSPWPKLIMPTTSTFTDYVMQDWAEHGDKVALVEAATSARCSYKELKKQVSACAAGLRHLGLRNGDRLAICAPNTIAWATIFLGTLYAGGVVVPIDPAYGIKELELLVQDSGVVFMAVSNDVLPTVRAGVARCPGQVRHFINLSGEAKDTVSLQQLKDPARGISAAGTVNEAKTKPTTSLALLMYSSGATGMPKGAALTHFNCVASMMQLSSPNCLEITKDDVVSGIVPFFHAFGMVAILGVTLQVGGTVVINTKRDHQVFLKACKTYGVTIAHVAPPVVATLARDPIVEQYMPLDKLRELFVGQAPLSSELARAAKERVGLASVRQGYGMTETLCSHAALRGSEKYNSVGRLLPNIECKIVDLKTGRTKGTGEAEVGELCVRGPNVFTGYLNHQQATSAVIDRDGFLHTGDLGYVDADGDFFLVDRAKDLIKFRGHQVWPAFLEEVLVKHAQIQDAAVIGVPAKQEGDGQVPKALIVKRPDSKLTDKDVKAWVAGQVSNSMRIAEVSFVSEVPRDGAGRILRQELRSKEAATFA